MGPVTSFITEVNLTMLDDGVVPISNIESAVRPHRCIDGTKRDALCGNDFRLLATDVAAAVGLGCESANTMAAKVVGYKIANPIRWNVSSREDFESAVFGASGVESIKPAFRTWLSYEN